MKPERLPRILGIVALLSLGALLSQVWVHRSDHEMAQVISTALVLRPLDLVAQLGLMLVCAFGIRALLPEDHEEQYEATDDDFR